jgi:hypothetical protein
MAESGRDMQRITITIDDVLTGVDALCEVRGNPRHRPCRPRACPHIMYQSPLMLMIVERLNVYRAEFALLLPKLRELRNEFLVLS